MGIGGQIVPAAFSPRKSPGTKYRGDWMRPIAGVEN
jgi:hypothetical protein